jgi:hypothetical protein
VTARAPGEPVVFVDRYAYDLPMLARVDAPLVAIDDWQHLAPGDDWRHELADGLRFSAPEVARRLVSREELPARLCGARAAWIVAPVRSRPPGVGDRAPEVATRDTGLWRLDGATLDAFTAPAGCRRTPNDAPATR